jgi:hypothetical protein
MSNKHDNKILIRTKLDGFIRLDAPGGKFNNCSFEFKIPEKNLPWFEEQYENAIEWARNNFDGKRMEEAIEPWEEDGLVKYSYGGDTSRPFFSFVDAEGECLTAAEAKGVGKGSEVILSIRVKPYIFGKKGGLSLRVLGGRILNLVPFGDEPIDEEEVHDDLMAFVDGEEEEAPKPATKTGTRRTAAAKAPAKARGRRAAAATEEDGDDLPF